ncbi:MAG: type II secretion system protein J [Succinivibrionaceae bacterium]
MKYYSRAFTLIEMVVSMVLLGISSLGVISFIGSSTSLYNDSIERVELSNYVNVLLHRLDMQLSNSVPYQLEVNNNKLSFVLPLFKIKVISVDNNRLTVFSESTDDFCSNVKNNVIGFVENNRKLTKYEIEDCQENSQNNFQLIIKIDDNSFIPNKKGYILNQYSYVSYYVENNVLVCEINGQKTPLNLPNEHGSRFYKFRLNDSKNASNINQVKIDFIMLLNSQSISVSHLMGIDNVL